MTVLDGVVSGKKRKKVKSREDQTKQKHSQSTKETNVDLKDNSTEQQSTGQQTQKDLHSVATRSKKSRHKGEKRKKTSETDEDQLPKRVKTEESHRHEAEANTKQESKTATHKKRKKKRKGKDNSEKLHSFLVQPPEDSSNVQASEAAEEEIGDSTYANEKKVPKKMKRPKTKQEKDETVQESTPSAKDLALSYLKLWKKDKSNWSFKKVRQIWLIKHLYDTESINKKYFKYLLRYLEESKGGVRSRLISEAQSIDASSSSDDGQETPDPAKVERARTIIKMLSE